MKKVNFIIDGHVHIYDQHYNIEHFFEWALANMERGREELGLEGGEEVCKLLLLTEAAGIDFFARVQQAPNGILSPGSRFALAGTGEACSLALIEKGKEASTPLCYLLRGLQVVTAERLEVLALATDLTIKDKQPIGKVIDTITGNKDIAVMAWGVGKWLGGRGKIIEKMMIEKKSPYLWIGDNSARAKFWGKPGLFRLAEESGIGIINGSDPLPFGGEEKKAGSYGFMLRGEWDAAQPSRSFREGLLAVPPRQTIPFYGARDGISSFIWRQYKVRKK